MNILENSPLKKLASTNLNRVFLITVIASVVLGTSAGFLLAQSSTGGGVGISADKPSTADVKNPQQDTRTFRDFAEGKIEKKAAPKNGNDYTEGTHVLVRDGAVSVALTSSVVDLSEYEGKRVKVLGETQKALKEGWLMDVGKVDVLE